MYETQWENYPVQQKNCELNGTKGKGGYLPLSVGLSISSHLLSNTLKCYQNLPRQHDNKIHNIPAIAEVGAFMKSKT